MLDIKLLRKDPQGIEIKLRTKNPEISLGPILALDEEVRHLKNEGEELKNKKNLLSKEIGDKKRAKQDCEALVCQVNQLSEQIAKIDQTLLEKETTLTHALQLLPNIPHEKAKVSLSPKDNVVISTYGNKPEFNFPFKNHVELNEKLCLFDFKRAAKISGSNWPTYHNLGARLEWALLNYMLDTHFENNFTFWLLPLLVRPEIAIGASNLPKFENQLFKVQDEDYKLYLIPTAEMALMGLHYEEILSEQDLPLKYVSYTPCFRREAGALGSQERGLIRMHQFNKVEMFAFTTPEQSEGLFQEMVLSAETILKGLGLPFRTVELVTGDMSFAASKTYDIEAWLPGQDRYYEVSSISLCSDFQSRRSNTRFRNKQEKLAFCHTLNGSGLATSRLMVALLENNQREDGSVELPIVLHKYLPGIKELLPQ